MEDDPDVAGVAGEVGGKVGPAGLGHKGGPVPLRDGQVVVGTGLSTLIVFIVLLVLLLNSLHIKGGEGDGYD